MHKNMHILNTVVSLPVLNCGYDMCWSNIIAVSIRIWDIPAGMTLKWLRRYLHNHSGVSQA